MPVVISMLRGVNVGRSKRMKMAALRALYASLKIPDPRTYVQSGNVIFATLERDLTRLAERLESEIERKFGFRPGVIMRTSAEMRNAIAKNPFAQRRGIHPAKLLITFLAAAPGPEARRQILKIKTDPEELRLEGRELYIYYPNGMGRSRLSLATIEKTLKTSGTARNWNSVTKLLEIAEELECDK